MWFQVSILFLVFSLEVTAEEPGPVPLFLYLACTYIHGDLTGSFLVHDIPTCLGQSKNTDLGSFQCCALFLITSIFLPFFNVKNALHFNDIKMQTVHNQLFHLNALNAIKCIKMQLWFLIRKCF